MPKIFVRCAIVALLFLSQSAYAQSKLAADTAYQSIRKIKNDSLRNEKISAYVSTRVIKKDPVSSELIAVTINSAVKAKDFHNLGVLYQRIGYSYILIGEYGKAYPYYIEALKTYAKINEPERLARVYIDMTWIQVQLKDYKSAEALTQTGLGLCKKHKLYAKEGETYAIQGVVFDSQEKFDKAIESYKNALPLVTKYSAVYSQISAYNNLGVSLRRTKRYDESLQAFLHSKGLIEKAKLDYYNQSVYQNLAELTFELKDYANAIIYIKKALTYYKDNDEPVMKRGLYENLEKIYANNGDYKSAHAFADSVIASDKKTFDKDKASEIRNLQIKYDTELKDAKIAKQTALNLQQQQRLDLESRKLQLAESRRKIEKLQFTQRQGKMENERKLQASLLQKSSLQAKLDRQVTGARIFKQNEEIKSAGKQETLLLIMLGTAVVITSLISYNQVKSNKLNKVILSQKQDLENVNNVKDRIFSIISHDMRAPVNTLVAFNHLLDGEDLSPEKMKSYAREIKKTLNHTSVLMENLLNWSSSQMQGYKPQLQKNSLNDISANAINSVTDRALQKKIILQNNIEPGTQVYADGNMTELIIRNILANAIKFTPHNGIIQLNAEQVNDKTTFYISDTGIGMNPDQVMHFNSDQYNYTNTSKPGTDFEKGNGLGLVLCKTFTDMMNGTIAATSELGKGSTFKVTLPIA